MTELKLEERVPILSWGLRIAVSVTAAISLAFIVLAASTRAELQRSLAELERPFAEPNSYAEYFEHVVRQEKGLPDPPPSSPPTPPPMRALSPAGEAKLKAFAETNQMTVSQARALYGWQFEKEFGGAPDGTSATPPSPEFREILRNADWSNVVNPVLGPALLAFLGSLIVTSLISYFASERHLGWIRLSIALASGGMIVAFLFGMAQEASLPDTLLFGALASLIGLLTPTTVRRVMRWVQSGFRATTVPGGAQKIPEGYPAIVWGLTGGVKKGLALTGLTVMLISAGSIVFPQIFEQAISASLASVMIAALAWGASIWSKQRKGRQ